MPAGESKPEWEIFSNLSQRLAARAQDQGLVTIRNMHGEEVDLSVFGEAFSAHGKFGPEDQEAALDFILSLSSATGDMTLADLREKGVIRLTGTGPPGGMAGVYADYDEHAPVVPLRDFVEKKQPPRSIRATCGSGPVGAGTLTQPSPPEYSTLPASVDESPPKRATPAG